MGKVNTYGILQNQVATCRKLAVSSAFLSPEMADHSFGKARRSLSTVLFHQESSKLYSLGQCLLPTPSSPRCC